jgi:hypothetical protein
MAIFGKSIRNTVKTHTKQASRPAVELLEDRSVPTVAYFGGAVLPHVEAQAIFCGSDWTNATYKPQAAYLDKYLGNIVNSSYMDMLQNEGYGAARGSSTTGVFDLVSINKNNYATDSQIRAEIQKEINQGKVQPPDSNRLYVFFVEDNVAVMNDHDNNATSQKDFLGYHTAFAGTDGKGGSADIRYAVIPYPGGTVKNGQVQFLGTLPSLTTVTSHELAEAVTDADVGYKKLGWMDTKLGEIGDISVGRVVYLNGYAVQREADRNDQAMTPAGATASQRESYVLLKDGSLHEHTSKGWIQIATGIASVSDQGIDNFGLVQVDVVTTGGVAYEYHDGLGWLKLGSGVVSAKAGNGASYLLLSNGSVWEYREAETTFQQLATGMKAIDAGTDRFGVSMVDVISTSGSAYEISNTSGAHLLANGVKQISAGQQGASEILLTDGNAYHFDEASGKAIHLASGVAQVTAGTDQFGHFMIDLLFSNGAAYEYRAATGWTELQTNVAALSKARAGVVDVLFASGSAYEHDDSGWLQLASSNAVEAV